MARLTDLSSIAAANETVSGSGRLHKEYVGWECSGPDPPIAVVKRWSPRVVCPVEDYFSSVVVNSSTKFPDGWAGYKTEWKALKSFIDTNQISGVVIISGDLHLGAIDNGTQSGFPEMCVSQPNGLGGCPTAPYGKWSEGYYQDPTCRGFGLVDVATDPDRLTLEVADEFGNIKISYTVSDVSEMSRRP